MNMDAMMDTEKEALETTNRKRKTTVSDVARRAGVSASSVSRVLNNVQPVSLELRRQVEEAVAEMGYEHRRGPAAYQGIFAVLVPDTLNPFFNEIARGIEEEAVAYGAIVSLVLMNAGKPYRERLARWLLRGGCDGCIYCGSGKLIDDDSLIQLSEHLPVVLVNRDLDHPRIPSIHVNFSEATERETNHLLRLGHRRFACLGGTEHSYSALEKQRGVETALAEAGIELDPGLILAGGPSIEWGFYNMNTILDLPADRRPTAVVAFNDLVALGAIHAMRARKVRVPDDVSIVGFDDIAMAAHANPPLTTVAPPKSDMGRLAVRMIHQIRERGEAEIDRYVAMESPLVVRESTTRCRS